jgi:hypothetical protein
VANPRGGAIRNDATRRVRRLALYEICAGSGKPLYFSVPWAGDDAINFLSTPDEMRETASEAGFEEVAWRDVTAESTEWFRGVMETTASRSADAPPALGLNLLMGRDTAEKVVNVVENLEEGRIVVVQGAFERA